MAKEIIDVGLNDKEGKVERKFLLEEFLERNKFTVGLLLLGIILVGAGVLGYKVIDFSGSQPEVQILGEESVDNLDKTELMVEVSGEIQKPGVYSLPAGSRVNDLLIMAGGLSAEADRDWVARNINQAQKLQDGIKIYIPPKSQISNLKSQSQNSNLKINNLININTASESELDSLWGIGPATAKKIIEKRPYQRPEELIEKKIVNSNVWEAIKDKVSVY